MGFLGDFGEWIQTGYDNLTNGGSSGGGGATLVPETNSSNTIPNKPGTQYGAGSPQTLTLNIKPEGTSNAVEVPKVEQTVASMSPEQASFLEALRAKYDAKNLNVPSLAQEQLRKGTAESAAQASSLLGSVRGVQNPALMGRQIAQQQADITMKGAGEMAMLRAAEAADQAKLRQLQESDLLAAYEQNRQAMLEKAKIEAGLASTAMQTEAEKEAARQAARSQLIGNLGTAAATIGAATVRGGA